MDIKQKVSEYAKDYSSKNEKVKDGQHIFNFQKFLFNQGLSTQLTRQEKEYVRTRAFFTKDELAQRKDELAKRELERKLDKEAEDIFYNYLLRACHSHN